MTGTKGERNGRQGRQEGQSQKQETEERETERRIKKEIMRAFVRLRQMLASHADLADKLAALEKKYDARFKIVLSQQ